MQCLRDARCAGRGQVRLLFVALALVGGLLATSPRGEADCDPGCLEECLTKNPGAIEFCETLCEDVPPKICGFIPDGIRVMKRQPPGSAPFTTFQLRRWLSSDRALLMLGDFDADRDFDVAMIWQKEGKLALGVFFNQGPASGGREYARFGLDDALLNALWQKSDIVSVVKLERSAGS